jgi:hypothetical protein
MNRHRLRHRISIVRVAQGSQARERLITQTSYYFVLRAEEKLLRRHAEIEEKIKQLKRSLDQSSLSDEKRWSILTQIWNLKFSPIAMIAGPWYSEVNDGNKQERNQNKIRSMTTTSANTCIVDGCGPLFQGYSIFGKSIGNWVETSFFVELINGEFCWRMVQTNIKEQIDDSEESHDMTRPQRLASHLFGIDKDSLSHFQNCRVPPFVLLDLGYRTHTRSLNLPTNGCFVSKTPHVSEWSVNAGGILWKKSKKRSISASNLYRKLLLAYLRSSSDSLVNCLISSEHIQTSQRRLRPFYSEFTTASWKATTQKHLRSSFFWSFLSNSSDVGNKDHPYGGIN